MCTIDAALLMQEQLNDAGFCSQLDADGGDDDDKGDNNVVDEDDNYVDEEDGQAEGLLKVDRTDARA